MRLTNAHTHTQFCDGHSAMEEMVCSAIGKGMAVLGFSPHGREYVSAPRVLDREKEQAYFAEFARLQKKYEGQIVLKRGVERDVYADSDCREFEYVIGAVHYLYTARGMTPVDGAKETVERMLSEEFGGDPYLLMRAYFRLLASMAFAVRPTILAHFDLPLKQLRFHFDRDTKAYRAPALDALHAARDAGCILEVNTGGMARSNQPLPYPEPWALKSWHDMGGQVILSSDCHNAPDIVTHFDEMPEYLKAAGYKSALGLSASPDTLFEEYGL